MSKKVVIALNSDNNILFNINEVAEMIGVVPATIRNWEENNLIKPKRKDNNYRGFDFDDIEKLKQIKYYSKDKNYSIEYIKKLFKAEGSNRSSKSSYSKRILGKNWKAKREDAGLSLNEVSEKVNISPSYLSQIENANANPSLDLLKKLAEFYGESLLTFIKNEKENRDRVLNEDNTEGINPSLPGVIVKSLVNKSPNILDPMIFIVEPGKGDPEKHTHNGEEFIYVLSGEIKVSLNEDEVYILNEGDSIYFKSYEKHCWINNSKTDKAKLLWVHSVIDS